MGKSEYQLCLSAEKWHLENCLPSFTWEITSAWDVTCASPPPVVTCLLPGLILGAILTFKAHLG